MCFLILFHKWKQTPLLKIVFYYKIKAILNQVAKAQGLPTTFSPKTRWKHLLGYPECFRSLEIHSKRCYKSFIWSVISEELEAFRNYQGLSHYYFSQHFMCNLMFYESGNFNLWFLSSSHFRPSENLGFLFQKNLWLVKYEKLSLRKS